MEAKSNMRQNVTGEMDFDKGSTRMERWRAESEEYPSPVNWKCIPV